VTPSGPPEVASVGAVLNDLGDRVADLLADERELVADLSHRLRTPITALQLDVDSLADPAERDRMAGHVGHLVDAVDTIIRAARQHDRRAPAWCDAAAVVRDRARFWSVLAATQGREVQVALPAGQAPVLVDAPSLGAALDVLVDNVFRHTPTGTGCLLEVTVAPLEVVVSVTDEGPGLADESMTVRGRSGAGSTGLGLDVAKRTAERAGGRLEVGAGPGGRGARVTLALQRAPEDQG
jgi:signal transduction histidine kinase